MPERTEDYKKVSYDYDYPDGLNLKPGTRLHDQLVEEIHKRARMSRSEMEKRFDSWRKIDETMTAYIPLDQSEKNVLEGDSRRPVSMVIPQSYATVEILLTYMMSAFLSPPIIGYDGVGPEDTVGSMMLEQVNDLHLHKTKAELALHTMWRDAFTYGFGVIHPTWTVEKGKRIMARPTGRMGLFGAFIPDGGFERTVVDTMAFEGNKLDVIDPYLYLPDPRYSIHEPQDGEFVGWVKHENRLSILRQEADEPDMFFNGKYLGHLSTGKSAQFGSDESNRGGYKTYDYNDGTVLVDAHDEYDATNPVDTVYMYIDLIPSEWELGDSDEPEKWLFALSADKIIRAAQPMGLLHDKFPIVVYAPDYDGRTITPISRLEILYPMQKGLNYDFNARYESIRKCLNMIWVIDPTLINMNDLKNPHAGMFARLTKQAAGANMIDQAVKQFPVNDISANLMGDANIMLDMMQRVSGATDVLGGMRRNSSERRTATEESNTFQAAISRVQKSAHLCSIMTMRDLGEFLAKHTQQLMSQPAWVKARGDWSQELLDHFGAPQGEIQPEEILVDYDVRVTDGTVPGRGANMWLNFIQVAAGNPELMQRVDIVKVFKQWARETGVKNVSDFIKEAPTPQVMPDEEVERQAQAGNITPMGVGAEQENLSNALY